MSEDRDELIARVAAELRTAPALSADLGVRIMARVRAEPLPGGWRALWATVLRPREVRVSPLSGLALAAGIAGLVFAAAVFSPARRGMPSPALTRAAGSAAADSVSPVQFVLVAPAARSVALVGDFNDWDVGALPLQRASADGVWTVTVPLAAGRYRYTFVVNGDRWVSDPEAAATVEDDFGRPNSIITVAGRGL